MVNISVENILCHKPEKGREKYLIYYGVRVFLAYKNPVTGKYNLSLKSQSFLQTYDLVKDNLNSLEDVLKSVEREFNNGITSGVRDCRRNNDVRGAKKT